MTDKATKVKAPKEEVHCPECGSFFEYTPKSETELRSWPQLKRYHLMIRLVYESWPADHEEQFMRYEDCRKWLQMKAGYREVDSRLPLRGIPKEPALAIARMLLMTGTEYKVPVVHKGEMVVWRSPSVALHRMGHRKFNQLKNDVTDTIRAETGLDTQKLIDDYFALKAARKAELRGEKPAKQVEEAQ